MVNIFPIRKSNIKFYIKVYIKFNVKKSDIKFYIKVYVKFNVKKKIFKMTLLKQEQRNFQRCFK